MLLPSLKGLGSQRHGHARVLPASIRVSRREESTTALQRGALTSERGRRARWSPQPARPASGASAGTVTAAPTSPAPLTRALLRREHLRRRPPAPPGRRGLGAHAVRRHRDARCARARRSHRASPWPARPVQPVRILAAARRAGRRMVDRREIRGSLPQRPPFVSSSGLPRSRLPE